MSVEYRARVFRNGRSRAVRIPVGIDLPGDEVIIRQDGKRVTLEPVEASKMSLGELLASWDPLEEHERMGRILRPPAEPVDW